jgi:hypothetical protein
MTIVLNGLSGASGVSLVNVGDVEEKLESQTSFRNVIINGNFDIWQRGTTQSTNGYGSADMWEYSSVGSTFVASRQSFVVGQSEVPFNPKYYLNTVVTSVAGVNNYCQVVSKIESVHTFAGELCTMSFQAKADSNKNMCIELVQVFGTGGTPSSPVYGISSTTIDLTTSWQKFTITMTIPSISGKTIGSNDNDYLALVFWFDAGSSFDSRVNTLGQQSGTFDISEVQFESGPVATPFEKLPIPIDMVRCRRFCISLNALLTSGYNTAGGKIYTDFMYGNTMKKIPAVAYSNQSYNNTAAIATNQVHASHLRTEIVATATASAYATFSVLLEAEL